MLRRRRSSGGRGDAPPPVGECKEECKEEHAPLTEFKPEAAAPDPADEENGGPVLNCLATAETAQADEAAAEEEEATVLFDWSAWERVVPAKPR